MLQMVMQVSLPSRITSYSISFQPVSERSSRIWRIGLALSPLATMRSTEAAAVSSAQLEIERLKLLLAKARREQYGQSSEREARLVDQLELQLAELEETVAEDEAAAELTAAPAPPEVRARPRRKPARRPLPEDLPRDVRAGDVLLLNDGLIVLVVDRVSGTQVHTTVRTGGELSKSTGSLTRSPDNACPSAFSGASEATTLKT